MDFKGRLDNVSALASSYPNIDETVVAKMSTFADTSLHHRIWSGFAYRTYLTPTKMSTYNWQQTQETLADSTLTTHVTNSSLNTITGSGIGIIRESNQDGHSFHASLLGLDIDLPHLNDIDFSLCFNYSHGINKQLHDYTDMNGDGYPDIVVENGVQYTNSRGGFSSKIVGNAPNGVQGIQKTCYQAYSIQGGGAFSHYYKRIGSKGAVEVSAQRKNGGSLGDDECVAWSYDSLDIVWMDINGDGLPDRIHNNIVNLNLGYGYFQGEALVANPLPQNSSFNFTQSDGSSFSGERDYPNKAISSVNYSFSGGISYNYSNNKGRIIYSDINGDGLVDKIVDKTKVYFNVGWGFSNTAYTLNEDVVTLSRTHNASIHGNVTFGATFGFFKLQASLGGNHGQSATVTEMVLMDMNADGLPDLVTRDGDEISVRYNQLYDAEKLTKVASFSGNEITLTYAQAYYSKYARQRPTVMEKLVVKDIYTGNSLDYTFDYRNYCYNIGERTAYGFDSVITTQYKKTTPYRQILQVYYNDKYKFRGVKRYEVLMDMAGHRYTDQVWIYRMKEIASGQVVSDSLAHCYGPTYPAIDSSCVRWYVPSSNIVKIKTADHYQHGVFGRLIRYINYNDTATNQDDVNVYMSYCSRSSNQTALVCSHQVKSAAMTLLRKKTANYDTCGNLIRITQYNNTDSMTSDFNYDSYGNIMECLLPSNNSSGKRVAYQYSYDTLMHQYRTIVYDTNFQMSSKTIYDVELGVPLRIIDVTGDSISYSYDDWGRLLTIRAPFEANTTAPTIQYCYWDNSTAALPGQSPLFLGSSQKINIAACLPHLATQYSGGRQWAQTHHFSAQDRSLHLVTYLFTDGFGRVAQTRKTANVEGQRVQVSSGLISYDSIGRVSCVYEPFIVSDSFQTFCFPRRLSTTFTSTSYDILDRKIEDIVHYYPANIHTTLYQYDFDTYNGYSTMNQTVTDPNGNMTTVYSDARGLQQKIRDAANGETKFLYNPMGEVLKSIDPEGFTTSYTYDMLGQITRRVHPDAGMTSYKYDKLGQLIKVTDAKGNIVTYTYDLDRLTKKSFPNLSENDVVYKYGNIGQGTATGKIIEIQDGSSIQHLFYDQMGNISRNIRTFAIPNDDRTYSFTMDYEYDSWARMKLITYPDGEKVSYSYDNGGNLKSMCGDKNGSSYCYIDDITYDKFGSRTNISYGNGTHTIYTYDFLHRLENLTSKDFLDNKMQNIIYSYDNVDNITAVSNTASELNSLGGEYECTYQYDELNRLVESSEMYAGNNFPLIMNYSPSGRIGRKQQDQLNQSLNYGYADGHAPKRIYNEVNNTLSDLLWDANGNLEQVNTYNFNEGDFYSRRLYWNEENRLSSVVDRNYYSYYGYDYAGDRTLKLTGGINLIDVNAKTSDVYGDLTEVTLYTSPYLVASNKGYTKHYYAGTERICARIGGGGLGDNNSFFGNNDTLQNRVSSLFETSVCRISENFVEPNNPNGIADINGDLNGILDQNVDAIGMISKVNLNVLPDNFHQAMDMMSGSDFENEVYFYHSDHLGSASWITDASGTPVQHLQYSPFGEPIVNQHTGTYQERFTFTGKERDEETGYSYFGARYMDADLLTGWLSVDPMSDKYPSLSPYNYCAWNPIKLVDPEGEEMAPIYDKWGTFLGTDDQGLKGKAIVMDEENFSQGMSHDDALAHNIGKNGFQDEIAQGKFKLHYSGLNDRPDYDGFVTISEGIQWARDHPNAKDYPTPDNTLYLDAAQLDLGFLTVSNSGLRVGEDYTNINLYDFVNRKSPRSVQTTYALGNTGIRLLDSKGTISFRGDVYDWDYHERSPMRNTLIFFERSRTVLNDNHGFNVSIYGTANLNQKWPF